MYHNEFNSKLSSMLCFLRFTLVLITLCDLSAYVRADCAPKLTSCKDGKGSKCPSGGKCIEQENWCNISAPSSSSCDDSMHARYCVSFKFSQTQGKDAKGADMYKIIAADVDWLEAEAMCQSEGYNLMSVRNAEDVTSLQNFFSKLEMPDKNEEIIEKIEEGNICDPQGAVNKIDFTTKQYWTGVYYDSSKESWLNTDGSKVGMDAADCGAGKLQFCLNDKPPGCNNCPKSLRRIVVVQTVIGAQLKDVERREPRSFKDKNTETAYVLCVRREGKKGVKWSDLKEDTCLKGYKCPSKKGTGKCLLGPGWEDSQICDGTKDCPKGEDETLESCGSQTNNQTTGKAYVLFPALKPDAKAPQTLCSKHGKVLPSAANQTQLKALTNIPEKFIRDLKDTGPSFALSARDWAKVGENWHIRLGIQGGAGKVKTWSNEKSKVNLTETLAGAEPAVSAEEVKALEMKLKEASLGKSKHKDFVVLNNQGEIMVAKEGSVQNFFTICEDTTATKGADFIGGNSSFYFYLSASHVIMLIASLLLHQRLD